MNRRQRLIYKWLIFLALLIAFALLLWLWFQTEPAWPADFSRR
jgi:hypothetical protein